MPRRLLRDRRGTTAIEYGLIAALIAVVLIGSFKGVANVTSSMWGNVHSAAATATGT